MACAIVLGASAWMQIHFAAQGDKGWLLFAAEEWVSGKQLYVDIFEVNPPLIIWMYAVPAWLSLHVQGLRDYAVLGVMGLAGVAVSIFLCVRLIARHPAFTGDHKRQALFALLLAGLFIFLTSPMFFFDRDHIMLVFTFPYLLRFAPSLARTPLPLRLRIAVGLLAAVGFCIKPHAALIFAALQLMCLCYGRPFVVLASIENGIILLMGGLYLAVVAWSLPEYIHDVLPMALATYGDFNVRGDAGFIYLLALVSLGIPMLKFQPRFSTPYRHDIYYFLGVAAITLAYAWVGNGWGYTYHPLFCVLCFLTVWLGWEFLWLQRDRIRQGLEHREITIGLRLCIASMAFNVASGVIVMASIFSLSAIDGYVENADNLPFLRYIQTNGIRSFGVMSGEFTRWARIGRRTKARWDTRFNHLWMVPALTKTGKEPTASLAWVANDVGRAYASDLTHRRPDAVFVDDSPVFYTTAHHVDLPALFARAPGFADAWRHYRFASTIDVCPSGKSSDYSVAVGCRYDVYRRADSP